MFASLKRNPNQQPYPMKKIAYLIVLAGLAGVVAAPAQTNAPTGSVAVQSTNAPSITTTVTATITATSSNAPVVVALTNSAPTLATNALVPAPTAPATNADIPLIQFSDVPLTTAVENLARQAGINYMLDPKINFGQPDASGQVKTEPVLSIRWENITAENALLALLDNYGLQMIHDKGTGIARITMKDPAALPQLITRVLQLKYSSVSNMIDAVQSTFTDKRSKVIADNRTSQLVIVATDPEQQAVDVLANQLDTPTRQVLIETKLVEISSNPTSTKGVDWTSTLQAQHVAFGNNVNQAGRYSTTYTPPTAATATTGASPAVYTYGPPQLLASPSLLLDTAKGLNPTTAFLDADGLSAVVSFLNSSSDAQIVSTPRVVTLDNEQAQISVTRGYPVFSVTAGTANTAGGSQVSYTNVGTVLNVTPRISANDRIWLKVSPQVSSYGGLASQTVNGQTYQADIFDFRTFDTRVLVPNAHTLVMGGLVQDNPQSTSTKVPLLGDIPYLGYLFRSENKTTTKDNLLIFITPTIVKDDNFQATDSQFLNTKPTKRETMLDPNSLWDGTRPYNWSDPKKTDPAQAIIDEPSVQ